MHPPPLPKKYEEIFIVVQKIPSHLRAKTHRQDESCWWKSTTIMQLSTTARWLFVLNSSFGLMSDFVTEVDTGFLVGLHYWIWINGPFHILVWAEHITSAIMLDVLVKNRNFFRSLLLCNISSCTEVNYVKLGDRNVYIGRCRA